MFKDAKDDKNGKDWHYWTDVHDKLVNSLTDFRSEAFPAQETRLQGRQEQDVTRGNNV